MIKSLVAFLHRLNGSAYTGRRIEILAARVRDVEGQVRDLSHSLHYQVDWHRYKGFGAPLYLLNDGRLALNNQEIDGGARAIVISIPKSGTYFLSAILEQIGLVNTEVHVWEAGFSDYRGRSLPEMVHRYSEFTANAPLDLTAPLIQPGQYLVGHIACDKSTKSALASFRRILAIRELRQSLVSNMRWFANEGRGVGHDGGWKQIADPRARMRGFLEIYAGELLGRARHVAGWYDDPEILTIRFEELIGDHGRERQLSCVKSVADHLRISLSPSRFAGLIESVLNKPTKTWSGKRSSLEEYWNSDCEALFAREGGVDLNSRLGYMS